MLEQGLIKSKEKEMKNNATGDNEEAKELLEYHEVEKVVRAIVGVEKLYECVNEGINKMEKSAD